MPGFTTFDPGALPSDDSYRLMTNCVVPRPIAWITTVNAAGVVNAAPFSSFNYMGHTPPMLAVSIARRKGALKDTAKNIASSGEFVVNIPNEHTLQAMHATSMEHAPEESEADIYALEMIESQVVAPPRIAAAPIHLECRLLQSLTLEPGVHTLFLGKVVALHVSDAVFDGRYVDVAALKPIVRLGGPQYGMIGSVVRLEPLYRPPSGPARNTEDPAT